MGAEQKNARLTEAITEKDSGTTIHVCALIFEEELGMTRSGSDTSGWAIPRGQVEVTGGSCWFVGARGSTLGNI